MKDPAPPSHDFCFHLEDFPGFSARDLQALRRYYHTQASKEEAPEKRVGWQSARSQEVRFEALASVGNLSGAKVLDLGCGLGGFYAYLQKRRIRTRYTGVDLFPGFVDEARRLHPGGRFEARHVLNRPFRAGSFDYVFLSGVFNVKVRDNWGYMEALLSRALRFSRKALAFNALNAGAGLREKDRFFVTSRELMDFGKKLGAPRMRLLDDYHHLDLTLFLYKDRG